MNLIHHNNEYRYWQSLLDRVLPQPVSDTESHYFATIPCTLKWLFYFGQSDLEMAGEFNLFWLYFTTFDVDVLVLFCFVFIVVFAYRKSCVNKHFPTGPKGLPFVGRYL